MLILPESKVDIYTFRLVVTYIAIWLLVLASVLVFGQSSPNPVYKLDWSQQEWISGQPYKIFSLDDSAGLASPVNMGIEVYTSSKGSFSGYGEKTPYIDGRNVQNFGYEENLGVIFDPEEGEGNSPVTIKLIFSQPVQHLSFTICDIDAAEDRIDSVIVFGNAKDIFPRLSIPSEESTVKVTGRNAVAKGGTSGSSQTGSSFGGEATGDINVMFGAEYIDSVTIIYSEVSKSSDPQARGIGLFAGLRFEAAELQPMRLLNFGIVMDENCQPVVRWSSEQEFGLEEYVVEYSYDGFNFFPTASVKARNQYSSISEYDLPLHRGLNNYNHFRLLKTDQEGNTNLLTAQTISGSECYHFSSINVYPNPSSGNYVFIEIEATEQKPTDIAIIDQYGELLVQTRYELKRGLNRFKLESRHLVPGLYNLRFAIGQELITKQVSILP